MTAVRAAPSPLREVALYFLRLGAIAFGGPAAHIAIMRRELVQQRGWISDQEFVDMLGAANLIPGPNSTELTMHIGSQRAGWWGLWVAGGAFLLPAVAIVLAFAWAYVEFGDTPTAEGLLLGAQPAVLAIILQATWGLRRAAVKSWSTALGAALAVALAIAGVSEVFVILGIGVLVVLLETGVRGGVRLRGAGRRVLGFVPLPLVPGLPAPFAASPPGYSLLELFLIFLKIGAVLYGSGYVLVSFMQTELVTNRGWLTEQQLLDAVAVGQFTPGPLFSTATFAGYVIGGLPGAIAATAGIFLPSFVLVAATHPLIPRMRNSRLAAPFLDGVNAAAIALMAVVTFDLAQETLDAWFPAALFVAGAVVLLRFNPNTAWIVLGGAAAGLAYQALT